MNKISLKKKIVSGLGASFLLVGMSNVMAAPMELSLQDSVDMAIKNNKTIQQADADAEASQWALKEAKGQTGFAINWQGVAYQDNNETPRMKTDGKVYGNVLKATVPLYTGGKVENNLKIKTLGAEIGNLQLEDTRQSVIFQVTSGYYQVLASQNSVQVAKEAVAQIKDHLRVVKAMYDAGVVAKSDVLRTEVELANGEQQLVLAENGRDLATMNLDNLMGLPIKSEIKLKDELNDAKFPFTVDEVLAKAKANNLTLQQVNKKVEQAKAAVAVARSGYLPTVGGYAQYSINGDKAFKKNGGEDRQVGLQATWSIFDNNVTHSQVKQAEAAYNKAQVAQKAAEESIELAASKAYLAMEASEKNIKTTAVAVDKAKEDYKIAQLRYSAGVGTNLDVVDSRVALTNAENNHNKALYDFNVAKAQLVNIMGK